MSGRVTLCGEDNGVMTVTLNRPEAANALSTELLADLDAVLASVASRGDVRAVVLTGAGKRAFCAGADLKERRGMDEAEVRRVVRRIRSVVDAVAALPVPVIAAIQGAALGGGLELALAADIRLAAKSAIFGLPETSLAIVPGAGGTQRLARLVGPAVAKELIFTARRIGAVEAERIGLVNCVLADGELLPAAIAMARQVASNGPVAIRQAKYAIDQGLDLDLKHGLAIECMAYQAVIPTADRLEGLAAFAEKRTPVYQGR